MAQVVLDDVGKVYPDGTRAVSGVDLSIADGELLVLVGPSGCGKTTVLRMVAGLESISEGTVRIGDRVVNGVPSRDRDVAMVFQSYALYPHLDVGANIGFGLKLRKTPKAEIKRRVDAAAEVLGLTGLLGRKPRQLSGGQRQRVAMGRAIVREPQAFLMDEPLSNLDAKLRVQMRAEVARIQHDLKTTTIYVTHDQTEAMTLGDRVAVMRQGELQQVEAPQVLYDHPRNVFVAGFIGSPAMNLIATRLEGNGDGLRFALGDAVVDVPAAVLRDHPDLVSFAGREIGIGIRPEDMEDADLGEDVEHAAVLRSTADLVEAMGSDVLVHLDVAAAPLVTDETRELARDVGKDIEHSPKSAIVARFSPRTRVREGSPVAVAVDLDRLHFFDPETGLAIRGDDGAAGSRPPSVDQAERAGATTGGTEQAESTEEEVEQ